MESCKNSTFQIMVLSTIFTAMLFRPQLQDPNAHPVEYAHASSNALEAQPAQSSGSSLKGRKLSRLLQSFHDLWYSVFERDYIVLIVIPRPNFGIIKNHYRRETATRSPGLFSEFTHLLSVAVRFLSFSIARGFAILRTPFSPPPGPKPKPQPLLPRYITPKPVDSLGSSINATLLPIPYDISNTILTVPRRITVFSHRASLEAEVLKPADGGHDPAAARFIATPNDLEVQIQNHRLYDLEHELNELDNRMASLFDFSWMTGVPGPHNLALKLNREEPQPILVTANLPQLPPPARRDGKTVRILPRITEVSEKSPDLTWTPSHEPSTGRSSTSSRHGAHLLE